MLCSPLSTLILVLLLIVTLTLTLPACEAFGVFRAVSSLGKRELAPTVRKASLAHPWTGIRTGHDLRMSVPKVHCSFMAEDAAHICPETGETSLAQDIRVIKNLPLLLNCYPLLLARLFKDDAFAPVLEEVMAIAMEYKGTNRTTAMLVKVASVLERLGVFSLPNAKQMEKALSYALKREKFFTSMFYGNDMQEFLETPMLIMEVDTSDYQEYMLRLPFVQLLAIAAREDPQGALQKRVHAAFGDFAENAPFETLFQRAVRLQIGSTPFNRLVTTERLFGIEIDLDIPKSDSCDDNVDLFISRSPKELHECLQLAIAQRQTRISTIASYPDCAGFDGVTVCGAGFVYDIDKCVRRANESREDKHTQLAMAVHATLQFHRETFALLGLGEEEQLQCLSKVHFVSYEWRDNQNGFRRKTTIDAFLKAMKAKETSSGDKECNMDETAALSVDHRITLKFLERNFDHNVHIVGKRKMSHWMSPTLLSVARLTEAVIAGEDEKK